MALIRVFCASLNAALVFTSLHFEADALQGVHFATDALEDHQIADGTSDSKQSTHPSYASPLLHVHEDGDYKEISLNAGDETHTHGASHSSLLSWPWKIRWPFSHPPGLVPPQEMPPDTFPERIEVEPVPEILKRYHHCYSKYIPIFGLPVLATGDVPDWMVRHAANVFAQYLDSDADGAPDNPLILEKMRDRRSIVTMHMSDQPPKCHGEKAHDYGLNCGNEGIPPFVQRTIRVPSNMSSRAAAISPDYDASLEEILHLIMDQGYAPAYPDIFSRNAKRPSAMVKAMSVAIGDCGYAFNNTYRYPECSGKYHYKESSCDFDCMTSEYIHWTLTTLLGGQDGSHPTAAALDHCESVEIEWEMCTTELLKKYNPEVVEIYDLDGDNPYTVPSVLPDGIYKPSTWPHNSTMALSRRFYSLPSESNPCLHRE